jgi:thioredoxin-related protein|tara:strand:- start:807 stop:1451 length:645 start_codon:yes stop_codon:yes gene_type:complete
MKKIIILILCLPFFLLAQDSQKRKDKLKQQGSKFETIAIGDQIPMIDNELRSVKGNWMSIESVKEKNGLIVIFTCNTCPFVVMWEDRYKLVEELAQRYNVGLVYVNSNYKKRDGDDSFENMKKHAKDNQYQYPYLLDEKSRLANAFGAKTTPHVFLFNNTDQLVYKGCIDDNHKDIKAVKSFYLKDAITQLVSKKRVDPNETRAVGCSIKRYVP